jgi:putative ABC transport system permease protein
MSIEAAHLHPRDGLRVASVGLRARPVRAALSALGIAIGTAAIVGVLGLSSSSQAGLIAEINRLGTNLLTVDVGQSLTGGPAQLPREAPARITLLHNVDQVADTALLQNTYVYRSSIIPATDTGGLQVRATSLNLLPVLGTGLARGDWLNSGTARLPVAVLGAVAAQQLGIERVDPNQRIWLDGQWFNIAGILNSSPLERRLRQHEGLGRRHPRRGVDGRHPLRHTHWRRRRPDAGCPSITNAAHRRPANGMRLRTRHERLPILFTRC